MINNIICKAGHTARCSLQTTIFLLLSCAGIGFMTACNLNKTTTGGKDDIVTAGQMLPDFSVTLADNNEIATANLKGKPSVLVLFSTTCIDCRKELPAIQRLYDEKNAQVNFLCISREQPENEVSDYWKANKLTLPYSPQTDRRVYSLFAKRTIPRVYISDKTGRVRTVFVEKASYKKLRAAINESMEAQ